jgi:hypothetical protein
MGYDIHITRKRDWFDEDDSSEIKLTEWMDYVQSDSEMKLDNYAETESGSGEKIRYENQGIAIWTHYSKHGLDDNFAWFNFSNGNVTVKNADVEIRNKMIGIAGRLNAKVQGDDGETYYTKEVIQQKQPWWKVW